MNPQNDPPFSYRTRPAAVDPALRRMVLGSAAAAVLVIAVAVGWDGMKLGMRFGPPPEIHAPAAPLRVAPSDPGGLMLPGADEQIMSGVSSDTAPRLAPAGPGPAIAQLSQAAGVPAPPPPPAVAPPATGVVQVQLAAAADQAGVQAAWAKLQGRMAAALAGRTPLFVPAVVAGQTIWRLRLGGFADAAAAQAFCAGIVAHGGPCTVANPAADPAAGF